MAEVDTSIYQNQVKPPDIMGTLSGVAGLQSQMNQNKLFQQQFNTNQAVSAGVKAAINPKTGEYDPQKLQEWIANDPDAGYGLQEVIHGSQVARGQNIANDTADMARTKAHIDLTTGYISQLMNKPHVTDGDLMGVLAEAHTKGALTTDEMTQLYKIVPRDQNGEIDQQGLRGVLEHMQLQLMSPSERYNISNPETTWINNGQLQIPVQARRGEAPVQIGEGVQQQPAPTQQQYNPLTRRMEYVGTMGSGQGAGGGFVPGTPAGPPLGTSEAAAVDATARANQGVNLQQRADATPQNKSILGNLEGDLGDFTSGPATEKLASFEKFLNANLGLNINTSGLAGRERFNKMSAMLAQSQFQTLGGTGTDKQLGSTELTSPNSELSTMGNKGIIALLKGNEDAIKAKNEAWQAFKASHGPQSYGQFSTQFNQTYDPRVFQSQYLDVNDRKKMISGLTQQEKNSLHQAFVTAKTNGWIK